MWWYVTPQPPRNTGHRERLVPWSLGLYAVAGNYSRAGELAGSSYSSVLRCILDPMEIVCALMLEELNL